MLWSLSSTGANVSPPGWGCVPGARVAFSLCLALSNEGCLVCRPVAGLQLASVGSPGVQWGACVVCPRGLLQYCLWRRLCLVGALGVVGCKGRIPMGWHCLSPGSTMRTVGVAARPSRVRLSKQNVKGRSSGFVFRARRSKWAVPGIGQEPSLASCLEAAPIMTAASGTSRIRSEPAGRPAWFLAAP